jgi:hypothetical protein
LQLQLQLQLQLPLPLQLLLPLRLIVFPNLTQKQTSSRPKAAHLPPQWRDPCISLLPLQLQLQLQLPLPLPLPLPLQLLLPLRLLVFPNLTQKQTSSRPKAAHFAAAVERSLYSAFVFAVAVVRSNPTKTNVIIPQRSAAALFRRRSPPISSVRLLDMH